MRIVQGELWSFYGHEPYIVLITVNGDVKPNGKNVMGKGCAAEARLKIPGIEKLVGANIQTFGNKVLLTDDGYGTFPVKNHWWEKADMELIVRSADDLRRFAESDTFKKKTFLLPRPGCGSGGLVWSEVKAVLEACHLPDNVHVISKSVF
jgi:hypothetical protein